MTEYDSLTGLYTRNAFCEHAEELIRNNPEISYDIVLSDFVNFKHFNERFGTKTGDFLLVKTGELLSKAGPDVICGRYGADRFVSLVRHFDERGIMFLENFRLPEQARNELPVDSIVVKFGVCANVTMNLPVSVFCDRAYMALQSVKHQYGKNVGIYDENLGELLRQELIIEENMQAALDKKQFKIYYQPKMDTATGKISGAEALVRWDHPLMGFLSPDMFIAQFEKNGFISILDQYVWEAVCRDMAEWKKKGLPVVSVSVNISRKDFRMGDLPDRFSDLVDRFGLETSMLHLEVTESCYAEKAETALAQINELHDRGFLIELDDFGAGYTSLSTLNDLKLDILKLDMSLLRKDDPSSDRSVLKFAMQLAGMMKLKTLQEGVENKHQLERIKELGCDFIQGYYYSKPLEKEEFEAFLAM